MNRIFLALLLFMASWSALAADVCGSPGEKPSVKSVVVHLQRKPTGPSFYYRTDLYHVLFVSQASMAAFLDKLSIPDSATSAKALVKSIRSDMPLGEDRDLFRYNFSDWFNMNLIESMLVDLLEHRNVALVAPGGDPVEKITIVHERTPDISHPYLRWQEGRKSSLYPSRVHRGLTSGVLVKSARKVLRYPLGESPNISFKADALPRAA